jgi:hypothetical protein
MFRLSRLLGFLIVALLLAGGALLASWDMHPPSSTIEIVIPNDRFTQ